MKPLILVILCVFGIVGCASSAPKVKVTHMTLTLGMKKKQITDLMGEPPERELYQERNETLVEFLIYPNFSSYEEKTPIGFIDNKLAGWGKTFYEDHISADVKRLK